MRRQYDHALLIAASIVMGAPLLMVFVAAGTRGGIRGMRDALPSWDFFVENLERLDALTEATTAPDVWHMVTTSLQVAAGVAIVTTMVSLLAAYAMVFFTGRGARIWFWLTLLTLYFPIEARMLHTFDVAATLNLTSTLRGLVLPVLPLALATLVFRQHLKTIPPEYLEAARLDGAGPIRFLIDFILPLSLAPIGAVLVITFVIGWNQYLWPLMISVDNNLFPLMRGLNLAQPGTGPAMVLAVAAILPPLVLVLAFLRLLPRVTAVRA